MNGKLIAWVGFAAAPFGCSAQWAVYDAAVHTQIITGTAQEIAKYAEMINNQVSQIRTLTDQLNEFRKYEEVFGNPKEVVMNTVEPLVADLRQTELGQSLGELVTAAQGAKALIYDARGLYYNVGASFGTPIGTNTLRNTNEFRPFAAINEAAANYQNVSTNAARRRVEIKLQIAATLDQLRAAPTAAEVAKLTAVLSGLSAALQGTEQEAGEALATTVVQDIENRNDEKKQAHALEEEQKAAFSEAVGRYGTTFRLLDAPTTFPK